MSTICPTITATTLHEYETQLERLQSITEYIHVDLMDGELAPSRSLSSSQIHWPETMRADVHVMYRHPGTEIETLVSRRPNRVIIHAEAEGDLPAMIEQLRESNIKVGVALLPETSVESARELVLLADHVLVFGGNLGYQGGQADLTQLDKVAQIRAINPHVEIGWDGGANMDNVRQLAESGVDVINVGSAIQASHNPRDAFLSLQSALSD
jgi:ribulose-phosphate 3-epimerase